MESTYTKSQLKKLGWNEKMIASLLPTPVYKTNPRFRNAEPMQLWTKSSIVKAMKTPEYQQMFEDAAKKKEISKKAVETKRIKFLNEVEQKIEKICVKRIDINQLEKITLREKQEWNYLNGYYDSVYQAEDTVIDRWMVNYVRHNLTEYDKSLFEMKGKIGKSQGYIIYKHAVLDKIAQEYPELDVECRRQKEELQWQEAYY